MYREIQMSRLPDRDTFSVNHRVNPSGYVNCVAPNAKTNWRAPALSKYHHSAGAIVSTPLAYNKIVRTDHGQYEREFEVSRCHNWEEYCLWASAKNPRSLEGIDRAYGDRGPNRYDRTFVLSRIQYLLGTRAKGGIIPCKKSWRKLEGIHVSAPSRRSEKSIRTGQVGGTELT